MYLVNLDKTLTFKLYLADRLSRFGEILIFFVASFFIYLLPVVLIVLFLKNAKDRINSIKILLCALLSWQVFSTLIGNIIYQHFAFRDRPFAERGMGELLFEQPQKAFPSDHSAVLLAVTLAFFAYKYPKLGWVFLVGGIISSLSRVMIGFHYVGDIVGGWLIGALTVALIIWVDKPLTKLITSALRALKVLKDEPRVV